MKFKKFVVFFIFLSFFMFIESFFIPYFEIVNVESDIGTEYTPIVKGYTALFDFSDNIKVNIDNIDVNKIGSYKVEASVDVFSFTISKDFYISIVDKEKPIIELSGDNPSYVCNGKSYVEEGYEVNDNYDGNITNNVVITELDDSILYSVIDSSGNESRLERKLVIGDKERPLINLNGDSIINMYLGERYYEPGYSVSDNCDGDITDNVVITGTVDTSKLGSYTIKYDITDSAGNSNSIERTVIVKKRPNYYGNGNIYLTFDDGPSYLTNRILDILDEEGVKATFFVTSANESTRRAYNSGHAIALHTSSHNYSYIYSSADNYFNDLNAVSDAVYNVIGIRPNIIRFPGGSSNTVSRNYNVGIMSYLTMEVVNRGYTYFDWNISSGDAGGDTYNSTNIYYNVVNNLSHSKTNVVLMHDSGGHEATADALRNIISYGKEYGYLFKTITSDTPVVTHRVNN